MKKYELTYRTIIETEEHRQIANKSTNELIHKIKLALIGNDESVIDEYDISIKFYDYGYIDLNTALSLIYDDIIIKRSSLLDYIKNTYDMVEVTFRSDKMKYLEDDPVDHYVTVDISYDPYILEIYVSSLDEKSLINIYIRRKTN